MINGKRVLGIIPARGGSKRLPRKNVLEFCGKPLIAWTIEEAKKSVWIDQITLTSDDKKILDIGMEYKINCVPRNKELADDSASMNDVVLSEIERFSSSHYDLICLLQPTSPLRIVEDIDCGITLGMSISVGPTGAPNGAVYVVDVPLFKQYAYFGGWVFYMPAERSIDINTAVDFLEAERLMNARLSSAERPSKYPRSRCSIEVYGAVDDEIAHKCAGGNT